MSNTNFAEYQDQCIKELEAKVRDLEARNAELERENDLLLTQRNNGEAQCGSLIARAEAAEARCAEYESRTRNIEAIECGQRARAEAAEARCAELERESNAWQETAAMFSRNSDYYQTLLDRIGFSIGDKSFICDDGSRSHGPLRAKMPELVDELLGRVKVLESELLGFVEYFGAIERGEVGGSRPKIRTFEKVLLDGARQALQAVAREQGDK